MPPIPPARSEPPPEVCDVRILVVDRLGSGLSRAPEQHGQAAGKRLDVVEHVAESIPDQVRDARFAAEPRERSF
jgi:hypothetical protein